jgi:transcription elongation factor Elf1
MSSQMRCPECGSQNVECTLKPSHQHRCLDCGYDGRAETRRAQVGPSPTVNYGFSYGDDRCVDVVDELAVEDEDWAREFLGKWANGVDL